jgi:hypothetical protein
MNPSKEITEMVELHLPLGDYCFAYVDEDLTVQVSTRSTESVALVGAFVSYMKAVGFSLEDIEKALYNQSTLMMALRTTSSMIRSKKAENTDEVTGPKEKLRIKSNGEWIHN